MPSGLKQKSVSVVTPDTFYDSHTAVGLLLEKANLDGERGSPRATIWLRGTYEFKECTIHRQRVRDCPSVCTDHVRYRLHGQL